MSPTTSRRSSAPRRPLTVSAWRIPTSRSPTSRRVRPAPRADEPCCNKPLAIQGRYSDLQLPKACGTGPEAGGSGWSQQHPRRCAVARHQLDRQADQLILARVHHREVKALDDPRPRAEERPVYLAALARRPADREVVDADERHTDLPEKLRRLERHVHEPGIEVA